MTNISKNELSQKTQEQLFKQFTHLFASADDRLLVDMFNALFTDSEKIMFIKRVAIVFLIVEGYSTYVIAKTLHVSDKTVRDVLEQSKRGRYDVFVKVTKKKSFDSEQFWSTVEVLLRCGLPPMGKHKWQWLNKK